MQYRFQSIALFQANVTHYGSTAFFFFFNENKALSSPQWTTLYVIRHIFSVIGNSKLLVSRFSQKTILNEDFKESGCKMNCTLNNSQQNLDK